MMKNLLGAVDLGSMIMNVAIILGIVIAGSLILYFVGEFVMSISNRNRSEDDSIDFGDSKKAEKTNESIVEYNLDAQNVQVAEEVVAAPVVETQSVAQMSDFDAERERREREYEERRAFLEARRLELVKKAEEEKAKAEEERLKAEEAKKEAEEAAAQAQAAAEAQEVKEEPIVEVKEEVAEDDIEDFFQNAFASEEKEEVVEVVEPVVEVVETVETQVEENSNLDAEREELVAQKERYEQMVKELEAAKRAVEEQAQAQAVAAVVIPEEDEGKLIKGLSLIEMQARLTRAEELLKANEKEFKLLKRDFIPLRKVWNTHEKDEKKLRRKEALVAKQKVLLYGVNNYGDIDEEKAKKLAEDLDLLDGLKLSVQHCEEVMKKNAERYPLLERMYNILKKRNDELKAEIEFYAKEIAEFQGE